LPFGNFVVNWYLYLFTVLVYCSTKNLATLFLSSVTLDKLEPLGKKHFGRIGSLHLQHTLWIHDADVAARVGIEPEPGLGLNPGPMSGFLKIFSPKNSATKLAFLTQKQSSIMQNFDHNIGF
jgi:hypothetical protein